MTVTNKKAHPVLVSLQLLLQPDIDPKTEGGDVQQGAAILASKIGTALTILTNTPSLHSLALEVVGNALVFQFTHSIPQPTHNEGEESLPGQLCLVWKFLDLVLTHCPQGWAAVLFKWCVKLLGRITQVQSSLEVEEALQKWLSHPVLSPVLSFLNRSTSLLVESDQVGYCMDTLFPISATHAPNLSWLTAHIVSQYPSQMMSILLDHTLSFPYFPSFAPSQPTPHSFTSLTQALAYLSRTHRDHLKQATVNSLTRILSGGSGASTADSVRMLLVVATHCPPLTQFVAMDCLHFITSAKIRKLMMNKGKTTPPNEPHDGHMTKKEDEEDEGEILSDDDEEMETDHKTQGPPAVRLDEMVGLVCGLLSQLRGREAVRALNCVMDVYLNTTSFIKTQEEPVEEGEIVHESPLESVVDACRRIMSDFLSRLHSSTCVTHLTPQRGSTGVDVDLVVSLECGLVEWADRLMGHFRDNITDCDLCVTWLHEMITCVCICSSELVAGRLLAYLLLRSNGQAQLTQVLEIYWEVHVRHPHLADSAVGAAIAKLRVSHAHSNEADSSHSDAGTREGGRADEMMCFVKNMLTVLKHNENESPRQQSIQIMRYTCSVCHKFASFSLKSVMRHIGSVHSFEPGFHITCGVDGCARTYQKFRSFQKHIKRKHAAVLDESRMDTGYIRNSVSPSPPSFTTDNDREVINQDLKRSAALFLLRTKEVNRVTQTALNDIVDGVTELFQAHSCDNPFRGLESEYLQRKYFKEEFNLLEPIERRLGQSLRRRRVKGQMKLKLCWDCAYDIPLLSSLKIFLSNNEVLGEVQRGHKRNDSLTGDYCDGDACDKDSTAAHPLFSRDSKALQILLFYDDLEVANPLGSYTKKHKIAVFYYTLANISPKYRSSLKMIQLVTTVKSVDVSSYGIDEILKPFLRDIYKLEKDEGVDFAMNGTIYNFRGSLALVVADNLASQLIGGYKALNSALRKCRHCMAIGEDMRCKFVAGNFVARTRLTHAQHSTMLEGECPDVVATTYGLTRDSILNTSRFFHVTEGLPPDCMHDLLEGAIQYEVKELLKSVVSRRLISVQNINSRIQLFSYCSCDAINKPSPIALSSADHSLKQSASQMWCLARLLPLLIGNSIPEDDLHWNNFLLLLRITDYVFSPISSHNIAAYLTTLIEEYLQTFIELYPDCPIIPKQHYMVHIPQWIVRCGPVTRYWCMRFEAKNSHFKDIVHRIKNFKNIPKSLALRHQGWICYYNAAAQQESMSGPVKTLKIEELPYCLQLCTALPHLNIDGNIQQIVFLSALTERVLVTAHLLPGSLSSHSLLMLDLLHCILIGQFKLPSAEISCEVKCKLASHFLFTFFALIKTLTRSILEGGQTELAVELCLVKCRDLIGWCSNSRSKDHSFSVQALAYSTIMENILSEEMSCYFSKPKLSQARILKPAPSTPSRPHLLSDASSLRPSILYRPKFNSREIRHSGTLSSRQTGRNHRNDEDRVEVSVITTTSHLYQLILAVTSPDPLQIDQGLAGKTTAPTIPGLSTTQQASGLERLAHIFMDLVAPLNSVQLQQWPEEDSHKYTLERDLSIKRTFGENPVLWHLLLLFSEQNGRYCPLLVCASLVCSLLTMLCQHWQRCRLDKVSQFPWELENSILLMECLAKAGWLPAPLSSIGELFPFVSTRELYLLLTAAHTFLKENFQQILVHTPGNCFKDTGYMDTIKSTLLNNISGLGHFYPRFMRSFSDSEATSTEN